MLHVASRIHSAAFQTRQLNRRMENVVTCPQWLGMVEQIAMLAIYGYMPYRLTKKVVTCFVYAYMQNLNGSFYICIDWGCINWPSLQRSQRSGTLHDARLPQDLGSRTVRTFM